MSSNDPFQDGKSLVFKTLSTSGTKHYLNSSPAAPKATSVYMSDSIGFARFPGCHWICKTGHADTYRFVSWSKSAKERYLDSSAATSRDESVYIGSSESGQGSYWLPSLQPNGTYILTSQTPSGPKNILTSDPPASKEDSVYLSEPKDPHVSLINKQWMVGVDYYPTKDVENIIHGVYPGATISSYLKDLGAYGSMDINTLSSIWKNSKLGEYQETTMKFDKDAFAACLKAEVAKYAYKQSFPEDWCCLCGIMWGIDSQGVVAAFNFIIDPFRNLILFDPVKGEQIDHAKYPSLDFCVL